MRAYQGDFPTGATVYIYFDSYNGTSGASEAITGLAVEDIKIFKNGSVTERASTSGFTLLDTDGIDFDGIVGINGFSIDLSDNTDAGFYAAGSEYVVVISSITVDTQTVNFVASSFSIERTGGALALLKDATYGLSALETLVDDLESRLTATRAGYLDNLSAGAVALASGVTVTTNSDKTGYGLANGAVTAAVIATDAIDADAIAASAVTEIQSGLSTLTAQQVWEYATRTLTSLGTLVADVWAYTTRILTAGTNIVLAKGTGITGFNDLSSAQVNTECDTALTDYDPPTRAEATSDKDAIITEVNANETKIDIIDTNVDAILVDTGTTLDAALAVVDANVDAILADTGTDGVVVATASKTGYALSTAGVDAILDDAPSAELTSIPNTTGTLRQMIQFIFSYFRNKKTITSTTETLFKEDASSNLGTATVSNDGTTVTKGEMS